MSSGRRSGQRLPAGLFVLIIAAGCSSARTTSSPSSSTIPKGLGTQLEAVTALTGLGDSVPYGTACQCTPYPGLTGADIATVARHPVETSNDAVPGYKSRDVLAQLEHDAHVIGHVEHSEAVMVEVGANDVAHSPTCATNVACYEQRIPEIKSNLDAIVNRIHTLAAGRAVAVVLLDYWSVWLGGQYAAAQGPGYVDAAAAVTSSVDDTIHAIAQATGAIYVDLRTAFRGPDQAWDETHLLAPDGDHPNAEGHQRIAEAVAQAVVSLY